MGHKLTKDQLERLFERVSKQLRDNPVEVQVGSLQLGERMRATWLPLLGLTYDPNSDTIEIVLEGLDVTIPNPREIHLDGVGDRWNAVDIVDAQGVQHSVELKEPLLLPAQDKAQ